MSHTIWWANKFIYPVPILSLGIPLLRDSNIGNINRHANTEGDYLMEFVVI